MINRHMLYSLRDINIIPSILTDIESRTEVNPFTNSIEGKAGFFPIIAAPMSCVLDENNWKLFHKNNISCVIPRTVSYDKRLELSKSVFTAFSLKESEDLLELPSDSNKRFILMDMANGHMRKQLSVGEKLKEHFPGLKLMGGNIALPTTYHEYDLAGFDYVRCGIGGGAGCLSSTQTGVHYGMASLISDIYDQKYRHDGNCKIIADGGIKTFADVIKALALGADYVMMGLTFAKAALKEEDLGRIVEYYGMSSKRAQVEMGNTSLKTSEGKSMTVTKEYTLSGWCENMRDYLRSSMSYCNSTTLEEFRLKAECQVVSPNIAREINDK